MERGNLVHIGHGGRDPALHGLRAAFGICGWRSGGFRIQRDPLEPLCQRSPAGPLATPVFAAKNKRSGIGGIERGSGSSFAAETAGKACLSRCATRGKVEFRRACAAKIARSHRERLSLARVAQDARIADRVAAIALSLRRARDVTRLAVIPRQHVLLLRRIPRPVGAAGVGILEFRRAGAPCAGWRWFKAHGGAPFRVGLDRSRVRATRKPLLTVGVSL